MNSHTADAYINAINRDLAATLAKQNFLSASSIRVVGVEEIKRVLAAVQLIRHGGEQ